ncbi:MAG: antitoxin [Verrucomicrobia bacterium]|nr:antitoxin [Verrucomicrobiota bacterium]
MRTTVTLDDDVFEAAKALAQASGKQLGQVLSHLARRGLRVRAGNTAKSGLPVFKVSPGAPVIPSRRAVELLAQEET